MALFLALVWLVYPINFFMDEQGTGIYTHPTTVIKRPGSLVGYPRATGSLGEGEEPVVSVLAGGVSNRTVLVERTASGEGWVVKQALPKLRVATDWFSDPERIHQEALGLRWLSELAPPGAITPLGGSCCWTTR